MLPAGVGTPPPGLGSLACCRGAQGAEHGGATPRNLRFPGSPRSLLRGVGHGDPGDSATAAFSRWPYAHWARRARSSSTLAVLGSQGSSRLVTAARAALTRSRSPVRPQAGQAWLRWPRALSTRLPHRQRCESAVSEVPTRTSEPPLAEHSSARALISLPGVKARQERPQRRNQALTLPSSMVRWGPWTATIAAAVRRARWVRAAWKPAAASACCARRCR